MILIDGARDGFLEPLLRGHRIGAAPSALSEVHYWKDDSGCKHAIDIRAYTDSGLIETVGATAIELANVVKAISSSALGAGELESLALVVARGERFCTVDRRAVRAMHELGVDAQHVNLRDLLGALVPPIDVPEEKYRKP